MDVVGNGLTGQINGLGIYLVGPEKQKIDVEFGSTCISIPSYSNIGARTASRFFTEAWNAAVDQIKFELNAGILPPFGSGVKAEFKAAILNNMQANLPGSSFSTGSGCAGKVSTSNAQYC